MTTYLPLILGMMVVTYLPRLLPMIALSGISLPPRLQRFLLYIPYSALGALIVRGAAESPDGMGTATLAGIVVAAAFSWFGGGLISSVTASIIAAIFLLAQ